VGRHAKVAVEGREAPAGQRRISGKEDGDVAGGKEDFDQVGAGGKGGNGPGPKEKIGAKT